jgi:hypothetical protein
MTRDKLARLIRVSLHDLSTGGHAYDQAMGRVLAAADEYADAPCCDLHGRNCEPPSELCCERCTEARHPAHPRGQTCSAPDLAAQALAAGWTPPAAESPPPAAKPAARRRAPARGQRAAK